MEPLDNLELKKFKTDKGAVIPAPLGVSAIFTSLIVLLTGHGNLFFVGIFLVGIAILFLKNGVEVDLVNHKYRDYKLLFGNYWGKWKPLAEGDYLLISKSTKRSAAPITMAMSATSSRVFYDLDLITKGSRDVILKRDPDYEKLLRIAKIVVNDHALKIAERVNNDYIWLN